MYKVSDDVGADRGIVEASWQRAAANFARRSRRNQTTELAYRFFAKLVDKLCILQPARRLTADPLIELRLGVAINRSDEALRYRNALRSARSFCTSLT